jgi:tRNA threonylcarbamoyladenosine biosynthesis protein TsaE
VTTVVSTVSSAATKELAGIIAEHVRPGDLLLLVGEMGAGKTTFAQGFAQALGIEEPVTSPTFTLARTYPGRLPMHHVDVYRLERMAEVGDLALGELIDSNGVTLVEWGDAILAALPASYLEVRFEFGDDPDDRTIAVRAVGQIWQPRAGALAANLAPWRPREDDPC